MKKKPWNKGMKKHIIDDKEVWVQKGIDIKLVKAAERAIKSGNYFRNKWVIN